MSQRPRDRPSPSGSERRVFRQQPRGWTIVATALVVMDGILALAGQSNPATTAVVLVLAPGLALVPFLPRELDPLALRVAVIPLLGLVTSSTVIISLTAVGIPLTAGTVRVVLLILTGVAVLASMRVGRAAEAPRSIRQSSAATLIALGAVVLLAVSLQTLVVGGKPVPGQDWGHYLLYVDQIRQHHSLLIDNPYWMLGGLPFPQDPGRTVALRSIRPPVA